MNKDFLRGRIILRDRIIDGKVVFADGIITEIIEDGDAGDGRYVAPGFIDIHIHGGGGADFMDGTRDAFLRVAETHCSHGTATFLPTTLTCPDDELLNCFTTFKEAKKDETFGETFYGLHLEGPYFSPDQAGAQDPKYLKTPKKEHYENILEKGKGIIARWSVAPELDGATELGKRLKEEKICASMGHSDAIYEQVLEGYKSGYSHLTHFYSGMSGLTRRHGYRFPGMIEAGYMIDGLTVEVIADGKHLPLSMLGYVFKAKGIEKCALITDAMRGAGQTEGKTILGSLKNGQECYIEDGVAKMPGGEAFAGSVATTDRLVRNAREAGADLVSAVRMMTLTPASIIGIKDRGEIAVGKRADFTVFDEEINVYNVFSGGKEIFGRK